MIHLKVLGKQEQAKLQSSKWKEIIKTGQELMKLRLKEQHKESIKLTWFFEKVSNIDELFVK
jgi:hypothetical protein